MERLSRFNSMMRDLQNIFHKTGKFADSNAKLDELAKILAIQIFYSQKNKKSVISELLNLDGSKIVNATRKEFKKIQNDSIFKFSDGQNIFGRNPSLEIDDVDHEFVRQVFLLLNSINEKSLGQTEKFDFLNEAFGYFIRDNFRNNVEDAQYMTPQEVVDFVCELALEELPDLRLSKSDKLNVCDPCCGVGSFLSTFMQMMKASRGKQSINIIGQDKVPRMAKFTSLNMLLGSSTQHSIYIGNTLLGASSLDKHLGTLDLILTNPPFGAKFLGTELKFNAEKKYPLTADLLTGKNSFSSEVLFLDRCLGLLREGGHLFAVVPDSVISSKGYAELMRHRLVNTSFADVLSIIELPTITFAQAGTRTKTAILHIRKRKSSENSRQSVFIAKSTSIGFDVSTRKGVTIKKYEGVNDLPQIAANYKTAKKYTQVRPFKILSNNPSAVLIDPSLLKNQAWTPNHYDAAHLQISSVGNPRSKFQLIKLEELAESVTQLRKKDKHVKNSKCISVLHVVNGDLLDFSEFFKYEPKFPGTPCRPGDLLFSKINPRIPRSIIVPDLNTPVTCSPEFEILNSKSDFSNQELKTLLFLPPVQMQIQHLTSGTSSSHNRIKLRELLNVRIPIPKQGSSIYSQFRDRLRIMSVDYNQLIKLTAHKTLSFNELSDMVLD